MHDDTETEDLHDDDENLPVFDLFAGNDFEPVTVAQLIETLLQLPQDALIVAASDGEGNGFSYVSDITVGNFTKREFMDDAWYEEGEEHLPVNAVCIWPVG